MHKCLKQNLVMAACIALLLTITGCENNSVEIKEKNVLEELTEDLITDIAVQTISQNLEGFANEYLHSISEDTAKSPAP